MTRALVLFVGVLGAGLPLWALSTYPVEDSFSRILVAVILAGLAIGVVSLLLRARVLDRLFAQQRAFGAEAPSQDPAALEKSCPELSRLVEARLRGERPRLEGSDALTRYLVSALVLVGLLGTFVGLVDALVGAREALGASADVTALRSALLAPMQGLSRAFGTSVAGISASAMLGLGAVLVRRAELRLLESVDSTVSGPLKEHTLAARQLAAFEKLGLLGENLPAAIERMADVASRLPALEQSMLGGHDALADALKSSVEKAATDLREGLERGLSSATKAHDELVERAVGKASSVLEERALALGKLLEDSAAVRQKAEKDWHESLSKQTRTVLETLDTSVQKQAERWDASTASLAKTAEERVQSLMVLEEERAALWREQLDRRAASDDAREKTLSVLLEKAAEVAERAASSAGEHAEDMRRFLEEQKANDRALVEEMRVSLAEQKAGDRSLVGEVRGFLEGQREGERALAGEMRGFLEGQRESDRALAGEMRVLVEEQKAADRVVVERVQSFLEEMKAADRALVEDMRAFLRDEKGQALAFSDDIRGQLEAWLSKASERDEARERDRLALEEKLASERQSLTSDVVSSLDGHASSVREQVSDMARSLADGADALIAGGIELTSLADRFSGAVDGYKEATREWLDRLGSLQLNAGSGGGDSERERFGAYLDQTREVFERSLEMQRELFSGLKALEPMRDDVVSDAGDDVVGADSNVSQPNATA